VQRVKCVIGFKAITGQCPSRNDFFTDFFTVPETILNALNIFLSFFKNKNIVVQCLGILFSSKRSRAGFFSHYSSMDG